MKEMAVPKRKKYTKKLDINNQNINAKKLCIKRSTVNTIINFSENSSIFRLLFFHYYPSNVLVKLNQSDILSLKDIKNDNLTTINKKKQLLKILNIFKISSTTKSYFGKK